MATNLFRRSVQYLSLALMAAATPLMAQTQIAAPATEAAPVEEVVVTGSRIASPNATSTSPIQVTTAEEIQQQGYSDMSDVLNRLPQAFLNASSDLSNTSNPLISGGGVSNVDLRGLGPQRTLVMVDGKRLGPGDPNTLINNPGADIDQIPVALVDRIEVLTGGASAVYGSDAIAGVVNFIMKRNFEGMQLDGQFGVDQHNNHETGIQNLAREAGFPVDTHSEHDGQSRNFSLVVGSNIADGKGNVTAFLTYRNAQPVSYADRDFASCQLVADPPNGPNSCSGSGNSNHFLLNGQTQVYSVAGNKLLPSPQPGSSPPAIFDSYPYETLSREDQRYNAGFMAHVDMSDHFKPYADFFFMEDKTTTDVAPSGLFTGGDVPNAATLGGLYLVNCNNPLLSAQEQSVLCTPGQVTAANANPNGIPGNPTATNALVNIGRRNIEGGPRVAFWDHTNYRAVIGSKGEIADGWTYDAFGQYYYTSLFNSEGGYFDYAKVNNALQVTGTAANPVCISGGSCVPYNIWSTGGVTAQQAASLESPGTADGAVTERIIHGDITGDLGRYGIQSPYARDSVGVNLGYEHRSDSLTWNPDEGELSGNLAGFSGAVVPINNGYSVSEGFMELRAPLASNLPGVKDLSFDTGYRYSKYSTAGAVSSYKFELQYAPQDDVRLRTSFERANRAPNVIELFSPEFYGDSQQLTNDPCAGANPTASLAQCARTGVTAAQYGKISQCVSGQCGQVLGGESSLKPETADTYTIGLTFTPTFLPNFTSSVDFYNIHLKNEITQLSANFVFNQCLQSGDPTYCKDVFRNPVTGGMSGATVAGGGYVLTTDQNIASAVVRGIDVQFGYRYALPAGWGSLTSTFSGTYLLANLTTPVPGAHTFDCAGLFGPSCNLGVNPRWRHNMRVNWESPFSVVFSAQWRFIGKVGVDNNDPDPSLFGATNGVLDPTNAQLPNISYIDLSAIYKVYKGITIHASVNNVLDKDPPLIATDYAGGGGTPNSFSAYDLVGRQAVLGFTATF
jgi:iron complex outermembrane recepter protein